MLRTGAWRTGYPRCPLSGTGPPASTAAAAGSLNERSSSSADVCTTRTSHRAFSTTLPGTDPRCCPCLAPRPRLPTTMRFAGQTAVADDDEVRRVVADRVEEGLRGVAADQPLVDVAHPLPDEAVDTANVAEVGRCHAPRLALLSARVGPGEFSRPGSAVGQGGEADRPGPRDGCACRAVGTGWPVQHPAPPPTAAVGDGGPGPEVTVRGPSFRLRSSGRGGRPGAAEHPDVARASGHADSSSSRLGASTVAVIACVDPAGFASDSSAGAGFARLL